MQRPFRFVTPPICMARAESYCGSFPTSSYSSIGKMRFILLPSLTPNGVLAIGGGEPDRNMELDRIPRYNLPMSRTAAQLLE